MILLVDNVLFLKYKRIYFPSLVPEVGCFELVSIRQCSKKIAFILDQKKWHKIAFTTLHSNLQEDEEYLFSNISKNTKYKINRAKKEGVETATTSIDEFLPFFNSFAPSRSLKKLKRNNLVIYKDTLIITKAFRGEQLFAMHAYVLDKDEMRVRLLYSATINRCADNIDLNLIGRANRLLHWYDMLYFKKNGFLLYDWGGVALDDGTKETVGIDAFKMAFGGKIVEEPHYESRMLFLLKKILRK